MPQSFCGHLGNSHQCTHLKTNIRWWPGKTEDSNIYKCCIIKQTKETWLLFTLWKLEGERKRRREGRYNWILNIWTWPLDLNKEFSLEFNKWKSCAIIFQCIISVEKKHSTVFLSKNNDCSYLFQFKEQFNITNFYCQEFHLQLYRYSSVWLHITALTETVR